MVRHRVLVGAALLSLFILPACGDGDTTPAATCDETIETCDDGHGPDGTDDTPNIIDHEGPYTQDELRQLGVIFPGDEGWPEQSRPPWINSHYETRDWGEGYFEQGEGSGSSYTDGPNDFWKNPGYNAQLMQYTDDRIDVYGHYDDSFVSNEARLDYQDWMSSLWADARTEGHICRPWEEGYSATRVNFYRNTESEVFPQSVSAKLTTVPRYACIQTPYGAGIIKLERILETVTRFDNSFTYPGESEIPITCHPTIPGIAFTRRSETSAPVAYTEGSIYDARVPVSSCEP